MRVTGINKWCTKCKKYVFILDFPRNRKVSSRRDSWCKECHRVSCTNYKVNNAEKITAYQKRCYAADPEAAKARVRVYMQKIKTDSAKREAYTQRKRRASRLRLYGITQEQFDELLLKQDRRCAICRVDDPKTGADWHVDHCHSTGVVRGLLCSRCNTGLGMFKDDPLRLNAAAKYLLESQMDSHVTSKD